VGHGRGPIARENNLGDAVDLAERVGRVEVESLGELVATVTGSDDTLGISSPTKILDAVTNANGVLEDHVRVAPDMDDTGVITGGNPVTVRRGSNDSNLSLVFSENLAHVGVLDVTEDGKLAVTICDFILTLEDTIVHVDTIGTAGRGERGLEPLCRRSK
jgi:hypothetical protein